MMSGGIDLSAVYLANLSSIILGIFLKNQWDGQGAAGSVICAGILIAVITGILGGILNGFLIGKMKLPAMPVSYTHLLEVFDFDMDKAALIGPAPYAAQFAADMRTTHNNFGLLVDLSHFPTTYETSKFVIQTLRPYITHLHIGNAVVKLSIIHISFI